MQPVNRLIELALVAGPGFEPVLAEKCHPCMDQRVSPNNPRGVFILSDGY
jgi:hypothetical protein